jgi:acetyl esterase
MPCLHHRSLDFKSLSKAPRRASDRAGGFAAFLSGEGGTPMALNTELQLFEHFSLPDFADVAVVRKWMQDFASRTPPAEAADLAISDRTIPRPQDASPICIRVSRPPVPGPAPVLVYFHGGSFIMGDLDTDHASCVQYARHAGAVVVSVQYRLAPEHRFPAGVEDCYAALLWVADNPRELNIDPTRIAVGGSSAGGALAAAVAIMARDRNGPRLALQLLVYPALDDRLSTPSVNTSGRQYVVTKAVLSHMWHHYLGAPGVATSPYAAPARITHFSGLAPAYIETCELDPLRDEVIEYASRMLQAGISADLRVIAGAPHGFDMVATAALTQEAFASRSAALRRALNA